MVGSKNGLVNNSLLYEKSFGNAVVALREVIRETITNRRVFLDGSVGTHRVVIRQ